jgi:bacteriorhodopsin
MAHAQVLARGLTGSQTYSSFQYDLVLYALVAVGMGLFASMIYALVTRTEVSKKYRGAAHASALISGVATLGYLALIAFWLVGFKLQGESWVPNPAHYFSNGFRYTDWTITVPLLTAELLAVCALAGDKARSLRFTTMAAAFLMIVTGFIGNELNEGATPNTAALLIWGGISTVFYLYLYVALAGAVRASLPELSERTATSLKNATILLFAVWGTYPVVYLIFAFTKHSTNWAITAQLLFCAADLTAKAGFGALIHKIAKLRTAEDALSGEATLPDIYPEEVYVSHQKLSEPQHPLRTSDSPSHPEFAGSALASTAGGRSARTAASGPIGAKDRLDSGDPSGQRV